jgi:hypothetical protein
MSTLSGGSGSFVKKTYIASATISAGGIPVIGSNDGSTDIGDVKLMAATGTALTTGSVGIAIDTTGTISATATSDVLVSVIVNPDLIIRAKMSGGPTEDTAMTIITTSSASSDGTTLNGFTSVDGRAVWGYDGANKGVRRQFDDASGGVGLRFPNAIGSSDRFLQAAGSPCMAVVAALVYPDITTNLTQMDSLTAASNNNHGWQIFDMQLGTEDNDGANNSFYHVVQNQHLFGASNLAI